MTLAPLMLTRFVARHSPSRHSWRSRHSRVRLSSSSPYATATGGDHRRLVADHRRREAVPHRPRGAAVHTLVLPARRLRPEIRCLPRCRRAPTRQWMLPTRQDRRNSKKLVFHFPTPRAGSYIASELGSKSRSQCCAQVKRQCEIGNTGLLAAPLGRQPRSHS